MSRKWTSRDKKIILFSLIIFLITISLFFSIFYSQERMEHMELELVYELEDEQSPQSAEQKDVEDEDIKSMNQQEDELFVLVDVKGAVHKPGVYNLKEGERVIDAILQAGDITEEGTTDYINLAQKLMDGMVIYVPTKKEIEDGHLNKNQTLQETGSFTNQNYHSYSGKVNINHASQAELEKLPGIGASRAQAIVEYRTQNGGFKRIEDIMNISGIGPKIFERLKNMIEI